MSIREIKGPILKKIDGKNKIKGEVVVYCDFHNWILTMIPEVIATKTVRLIPGRLRITVDHLHKNSAFAQYLAEKLQNLMGIKSVASCKESTNS